MKYIVATGTIKEIDNNEIMYMAAESCSELQEEVLKQIRMLLLDLELEEKNDIRNLVDAMVYHMAEQVESGRNVHGDLINSEVIFLDSDLGGMICDQNNKLSGYVTTFYIVRR
jgi:hypothetical protein